MVKRQLKENKQLGKSYASVKITRRLGILLFVVGFVLYANTLHHGFVLDDYSVIKENYIVKQGFKGIPTILTTHYREGYWNNKGDIYRPLSLVMFAAEWDLFNYTENTGSPGHGTPFGMHLINVLLYAFTGVLLFLTLKRVMHQYTILLPFLIALLFIAHPIHTEVVANIKSRDEILSFMFALLSIQFLWRYFEHSKPAYFIGSLVFFFLGFLSKEGIITFLAVIPALIYFFTEKEGMRRKLLLSLSFLIPTGLYLGIRYAVLGALNVDEIVMVYDNLLVATTNDASIFERHLPTAILLLGYYLKLLLMPFPLRSDYSYNQIPLTTFSDWRVLLLVLIFIAMIGFLLYGIKKRAATNNNNILLLGIFFFLTTISLYSNVFTLIGTSLGERLLYVPSLGYSMVLAYILFKIFKIQLQAIETKHAISKLIKNTPFMLVLMLILSSYSGLAINRNIDWVDNYTLYSSDVKRSPNSSRAHYHYGLELSKIKALNSKTKEEKNKYLNRAIAEFKAAAQIYDKNPDVYDQMGIAFIRSNQFDNALICFEKAVELDDKRGRVYSNMGMIYFNRGKLAKAQALYEKAVELDPTHVDGWYNLGSTYGQQGLIEQSIEAYKQCLKYNPQKPEALYYMGFSYFQLKQFDQAEQYFKKSLNYAQIPECYFYLGAIYQHKGQNVLSQQHFEKAFALKPALRKQ